MALFKMKDGGEVFYREWLPASASVPGQEIKIIDVALCLHGVESHSEWFEEVAAELTKNGMAAFAYDRAGWGHSDGFPGHLPSYRVALAHLEEVVNFLRSKYVRVHLVGLSWGGMFAAYAALRRTIAFDSLTLLAPGFVQKKGLTCRAKLRIATDIIRRKFMAREELPFQPADFTSRPDKIEYFRHDIWRNASITAGFAWETLKMRAFCRQKFNVRALPPTTILLAQHDSIIDNIKTRQMISAANVEVDEVFNSAHSLVFERPEICANKILATAKRSRNIGKKVTIVGCGAVGGFIGAMLALNGNRVKFIARPTTAEIINSRGITLKIGGSERRITERLAAVTKLSSADCDLLIVAVKSYDTESALSPLVDNLPLKTPIVTLQNGVNNERKIRELFPQHSVFGGVICAYIDAVAAGQINVVDDQIGLAFGEHFAGENLNAEARLQFDAMLEIFRSSGCEVAAYESLESVKWSKLCLNVAFNALNAATGLSIPQIMADENYGLLAATALKETFATMKAAKILPVDLPNYPIKLLSYLCRLPVGIVRFVLARRGGGENSVSSMRQDLRKKSLRTEIDEMNGAIVALAEKHNMLADANREICKLLARKLSDD